MQYSIVNYKEIDKKLFRLEAEFYNSTSVSRMDFFTGEEIIDFVQYGTSKELNEECKGFPTLRLNEFDSFFIKMPEKYCEKISTDTYKTLTLKKGDILICRTNGNPKLVGKSAIVPEDYDYAFASYLFRIRTQKEKILPTTLVTYLNSSIGRNEIEKYLMISNQANFSPAKFREILIPKFGNKTQSLIDALIWNSFNKHSKSKKLYIQAETLLLSEIGLLDWRPGHCLSFVKTYRDAAQAQRIDAEYFQPKYDEIVKAIKSYKGGWDTLGNLCSLVGHPSNPPYAENNDKDKTFIVTQKHLGNYSLNDEFWKDEDALYTTNEFVKTNSQYILKQDDVLLYSVGAYIGKTNIYKENIKATIGSFLTLLRAKKERIDPYYLMVFLNTEIGVMMSKQHQRGMAQQYLYPYDIRTFPIPLLNEDTQTQIQQKISESFNLRKQSKHLLACAKQAVEIAIEKDEKTAMQWLKKQTKNN